MGWKMVGECYITTIKDLPTANGRDRIEYIDQEKVWGFGYGAPGLTNLKEGDKICFYLTSTKSIVLHGIVASSPKPGDPPEHWEINDVDGLDYYDTEVDLIEVQYVKPPVKIPDVREKLGLSKRWGTYVIQTHRVDPAEFNILIGLE